MEGNSLANQNKRFLKFGLDLEINEVGFLTFFDDILENDKCVESVSGPELELREIQQLSQKILFCEALLLVELETFENGDVRLRVGLGFEGQEVLESERFGDVDRIFKLD